VYQTHTRNDGAEEAMAKPLIINLELVSDVM
jgi:hypothetical protein